jgi:hypothetical protein
MKLKLDRIISIATLFAAMAAIFLVLKRPAPVVNVQVPAATAAAQPVGQTMGQFEQAAPASGESSAAAPSQNQAPSAPTVSSTASSIAQAKPASHSDSGGIGALLSQAAGAAGLAGLSPGASVGSGEPNIKDQQVTYEGDVVHGRFLTEIAGKDVWVTISGHMGSKDGYATFDPTEFKVGDVSVPVELVNPALQRKLAEQRDKLKLPE